MKKILIINGHPTADSYCSALVQAYKNGAKQSGNEIEVIHLCDLNYKMNLEGGYSHRTELEPDLLEAQQKIKWSQHLVVIHPVWWGSTPGILKGFFDRVLLPGFAFKYRQKGLLWDKLLSGKTGRIIYTTDTPVWFYRYFYSAPSVNQVKKRTLEFCGITPVKVTGIGPIRVSKPEFRKKWLDKVTQLGQKGA